jgi:rSAM-associated Gly-rich repeat protein
LSAFTVPAANATTSQPTAKSSLSIEGRLNRITAAIRSRETQIQDGQKPGSELLMAYGFGDGSRGGSFNQAARGGTATGAGGGSFGNAHPYYGRGAGWADGGGFVNGGFKNGGGFVNGSGGGSFYNY